MLDRKVKGTRQLTMCGTLWYRKEQRCVGCCLLLYIQLVPMEAQMFIQLLGWKQEQDREGSVPP